jgi:ribosomal protein S27AE
MEKIIQCPRCNENFIMSYRTRMGICPWCEEGLILTERELSRKCGLHPMTKTDVEELNKYWQKKKSK